MEKKDFIKRNILSFVRLFFIMIILLYFIFNDYDILDSLIGGAIVTPIYHIPALINFFRKKWSY
jgi:hypothetical protein